MESVDPERASEVQVYQGTMPEGLMLSGNELRILPGFEGRYEVVGEVTSEWDTKSVNRARATYWYVNFREDQRARERFCKAQTPLRILTLGIWLLFPTQWVCYASVPDPAENIEWHVRMLRRGAQAMGANLIVVAGSRDFTYISGQGTNLSVSHAGQQSLFGFAVIDRQSVRAR